MDFQKTKSKGCFVLVSQVLVLLMMLLMIQKASAASGNLGNNTDQLALLQFKQQIENDPNGILDSWNDSQNHCQWLGIECDSRSQRVISLNLQGQSLLGTISPHVGNLTFLRFFVLTDNRFYGQIPQEVSRLSGLKHLNLTNNTLGGEIPANLSQCIELNILDLRENKLVGKIPDDLGSLTKLVTFFVFRNNLTGEIPKSLGNISSLQYLTLSTNNLVGSIPNEMGQLTSLTYFAVGINNLSGMIPPSIYNISNITVFSFDLNQFIGSLPPNLGLTLPSLRYFGLGGNQFRGNIPSSFANASHLQLLDLSVNNFVGQVPNSLGILQYLKYLNLEINSLGSNTTQDLSFVTSLVNCSNLQVLYFDKNNFGGLLPNSIANLSTQLGELGVGRNQICGTIPDGVQNLVNLYGLGMESNLLSGNIPSFFGKIQGLQVLMLNGNRLSGEIPSSLGNITQLYQLELSGNELQGNIPSSLGNCQNLKDLDISLNSLSGDIPPQVFTISSLSKLLNLSWNSLTGHLPLEVGTLTSITAIDVSNNKLSGDIPATIGDCMSLQHLDIHNNFFQGNIPSTVASLRGLQYLDLSQNNLSGQIPLDLVNLPFMQYLNLSYNNLEGEVQTKGVFGNLSSISLIGNAKLCGGIPGLQLPSCPSKEHKKSTHLKVVIVSVSLGLFFLVFGFFGLFLYWRKAEGKDRLSSRMAANMEENSSMEKFLRVSYHELHQATAGFSSENLIGRGSFGSVYKAKLNQPEERLVAVKVFDFQDCKSSKSFKAECTALRDIRHRNLVKILTYCYGSDLRGNEFQAIVYEFMANGSLDMWLHPMNISRSLNFFQRLRIAIDVASAVNYLHSYCEPPIVHCDLKPSNILLDTDMKALVSDFGLARLLPKFTSTVSELQTSSIGIKGSIGYVAPEYGMGGEASRLGDVYSYGILLLELFTGKGPLDDIFQDGLNVHNYVKMAFPEHVMKIVDPMLFAQEAKAPATIYVEDYTDGDGLDDEEDRKKTGSLPDEKWFIEIFELALGCSKESPKERIDMDVVLRRLHVIRNAFPGSESITSHNSLT